MSVVRVTRAEWCQFRGRGDGLRMALLLLLAVLAYGLLLGLWRPESPLAGGLVDAGVAGRGGFHLAFRVSRDLALVLGVLLVQWGAASIAGERERGTLRLLALRVPHPAIVLGKILFLALLGVGLTLAILQLALLVGDGVAGLRPVRDGHTILVDRGELVVAGLAASLLTALPLVGLLSLATAVSALARTAAAAQAGAAGTVLALAGLALVPGAGRLSCVATLAWPFSVALDRSAGLATAGFGAGLAGHLAVNGAWILAGVAFAVAAGRRREVA